MDTEDTSVKSKIEPVGYCRPPQHSRFKKGQSGNPHGRPKGTPNLATVLEKMLRQPVIIEENGKRKKVTKLEAAVKQLADKAVSGEMKALQLLTALVRMLEASEAKVAEAEPALDQADEQVFLGILKRLGTRVNEEHEHENPS